MQFRSRFILTLLSLVLLAALLSWHTQSWMQRTYQPPLRIGTVAGPHNDILYVVQELAAEQGFPVEVIVYNDYIKPNTALAAGKIDLNSSQHRPYLAHMVNDGGYAIVPVAATYIAPLGFYSPQYRQLTDIPPRTSLYLPEDPTGLSRSLLLLAKHGLITLRPSVDTLATLADISENPREWQFVLQPAREQERHWQTQPVTALLSRSAKTAGLTPQQALLLEAADSPYVNIIATRTALADDPRIRQFLDLYRSPAVRDYMRLYYPELLPAW